MSWHDPARIEESAEDRELREELRALLGMEPEPAAVEPVPDLSGLADELQREALRRRHAPLRSRKSAWPLLLAAGLPIALVLGSVGAWGVQQKRRADELAAAVQQKETEMQRQALVNAAALERERQSHEEALVRARQEKDPKARELVIPSQRQVQRSPFETQTVGHRNR